MDIKIEMAFTDFNETEFSLFIRGTISNTCDKSLCKSYEIVKIWEGSVYIKSILSVDARGFQDQNKTNSLDTLNNTFSNVSSSTYLNYSMSVENNPPSSDMVNDVCKATNVKCVNGYHCESNRCRNNCIKLSCGEHGICESLQNYTIFRCRCTSETYYDYQGTNCNEKAFKWQVLVGISVAVAFAIIVVIVIAFLCYCYKMRVKYSKRSRYAESLNDAFGLDTSDMPLTNFADKQEEGFQFYHNQNSKAGVSNEGFVQADYNNASVGRNYDNDSEGYTNQTLTSSFTANLSHIDPKADVNMSKDCKRVKNLNFILPMSRFLGY
ncbi:hypothetical protein LOTGIDRAFT_236976 [Lottia gigantea]|uniref:Uncharacterized protein n=1 Tax=Lottia gigantea TaxID=225164 RepID=V3ZNP9_LOTGI|nr:hypothetical protein LOTGIDRAFT_236976 [Lottia gigantea]ESO82486.1 hypothetical protein LOTGIDRAFT_236976 [Lottia gigantea]